MELPLYRIAQEALGNVVRHAAADHAQVTLTFRPAKVTLTVIDNGPGFAVPASPAELAPQARFGLLGIHERAELIGAHLAPISRRGDGTQLQPVATA